MATAVSVSTRKLVHQSLLGLLTEHFQECQPKFGKTLGCSLSGPECDTLPGSNGKWSLCIANREDAQETNMPVEEHHPVMCALKSKFPSGTQLRELQANNPKCFKFGNERTMTASHVTGFYAFFLRPEIGQLSPHFWAVSLLNCTVNLEKRGKKTTGENSKNPLETAPRDCRFLSLVVVEHFLTKRHYPSMKPSSPLGMRKPC